ncbi:hypothetical protein LEP1GSC047_4416 [Leptospira inadai serovar Lyme str. 10]|uniref:Uncharacterized protein n=2 Tax=Leptospira inadai serovar Lyme TaxID=293084 RepID=V6HDP1_9LEPT|nr:hypothetical protein [Leptospira inadai]EQA38027.1 hypothetical protein LEP1GSC047_4416 [Leptospira inadai serovar Lyme str. 10]PNV76088.1 hypothetical protein BES34_006225 [Leptospira inadai serovar Lyme]
MSRKLIQIAITISFCFPYCSEKGNFKAKDKPKLVECTRIAAAEVKSKKSEQGCIPFGQDHICFRLAESIKNRKLLEFMSGVWINNYDPNGKSAYKIKQNGELIQYASETIPFAIQQMLKNKYDFKDTKIAKVGKLELSDNLIKLQGVWIFKDTGGLLIANETVNKIACFVGMPDQISIEIIPEIGLRPYTFENNYYEPANIEIDYPSGEMREVK